MTDDSWIAPALAANPSAPDDLLTAMAATHDEQTQLDLIKQRFYQACPTTTAAVLADSPHWKVRWELALSLLPPDEVIVKLADDPEPIVRLGVAGRWEWHGMPQWRRYVPDEAYQVLVRDDDSRVLDELIRSYDAPAWVKREVARRLSFERRCWIELEHGTDDEAAATYHRMLTEPGLGFRKGALRSDRFRPPVALVADLLADPDCRFVAIGRVPLTSELARTLVADADPAVRSAVAQNPELPPELVEVLARDPDREVREALLERPELPLDLLDSIEYDVNPQTCTEPVGWLWARRHDPELLARYARSRQVRYRRTVAGFPGLAPETVELLGADDDFAVRLMLTEHNPERVPVPVLVEMVRTWRGRSRFELARNPRLPDEVIDQLVRSPDPRHRWLAYYSGRLTEQQSALLADDPDPDLAARVNPPPPPTIEEFRARLADPALTPTPDHGASCPGHYTVREATAQHPELPVALMWELWRRAEAYRAASGTPTAESATNSSGQLDVKPT